ncbi:unnamed protein product [Brassica napus]|uniref:RING-type E3 ubiquitin transferase n=1 Tax=Brassica napus TaxID=3708 RepID=A0A816UJ10_BRANA|nr:unnamed protein product [Brassica napus]
MCVCVCVSDRNSGALNGLTSSENAAPADAKNLRVKLVLLGDSGVGKSCIVLQFVRGQFDATSKVTVGASFLSQTITLQDSTTVKFEIWDTAGQERYSALAPLYYRGAGVAVIVYDITSPESFKKAQYWVKELQKHGSPDIVMALVGNKADLHEKREVPSEDGMELAEKNGMFFIETSAKTADNINELFETLFFLFVLATCKNSQSCQKTEKLERGYLVLLNHHHDWSVWIIPSSAKSLNLSPGLLPPFNNFLLLPLLLRLELSGMGSTNEELMSRLVDSVKQISKFSNSKGFFGRIQGDLVRRITLLSPFFEELIDIGAELNEEQQLTGFEVMMIALDSSLQLFRSVNGGSKLLQIVHRGSVMQKFHDVTVEIEAALTQIPYDHFEVSEEVIEQVKLLHSQFKRATERQEDYDLQLSHDLAVAESVVDPDPETLKRLSQELQLSTIDELKKESHAIHEYFLSYEGDPDDCFQRMSSLLKKLVDCASTESSEPDASTGSKVISRHRSPVIPEYFRCPISLELMKDPVIVSTGQTYERSSIQKWLDAGHKTCPKSQETLLHSGLTPNYVLKSLIALWCESNGIELPQNQGSSYRTTRPGGGSSSSDCDRAFVLALLEKLANGSTEQQRAAAGELRLLAKRNADNRVCIAEAGAIPLLVELLSSPDPRTQEHSVTALLNLSINEGNKGAIVDAGAITDIVEVLKNGSMEARENAAATLFSLSVVDENKVAIGAAGAIQALISLLEEGTRRGKKDAATAIFNLCIYQGNKSRAIKGGIVDPLTRLLKDAGGGMVDEALAILAILSTNQEGKAAIAEADTIPVLVEIIRTGSPRNRENAAAILWYLCIGNMERLNVAREVGADVALKELTENGTDRAKRKAASLLEIIQQLEGVAISTVP